MRKLIQAIQAYFTVDCGCDEVCEALWQQQIKQLNQVNDSPF